MNFYLSLALAKELQSMKRIPAIKMLRNKVRPTGFSLGLQVARDIVDSVQTGRTEVINLWTDAPDVLVKVN